MPTALENRPGMSFFTDPDGADAPEVPEVSPAPGRAPIPDGPVRSRTRRASVFLAVSALVVAVLAVLQQSDAAADPTAHDWYRLRVCESSDNYKTNTGNGHYGAYQFDLSTWRSVGGSGYPYQASPAEQDKRALLLYHLRGWQPWQCAKILGLGSSGGSPTPRTPHGWPGVRYTLGDRSSGIATWQKQMHKRGATNLEGTGSFGTNTLAVIKSLQAANHRIPSGVLGPVTWELAWTGTFQAAGTTPAALPWPGQTYVLGSKSGHIGDWQKQMNRRGAASLHGTGSFGANTVAVVKALQKQNGRVPSGKLGRETWALAWTGKYR
jgi:resuscitation-promoting factor RpfA